MTPKEFRAIRVALGLTQEEAAHLLGLGRRESVARYEMGARAVSPPVARLMLLLRDVKDVYGYLAAIK
jgi:transcriptional regulator with XRE-family HTH domain